MVNESSNARGGININFSDGSTAGWHATDTAGAYVNSWTVTDQTWHLRTVDLSTWQGKTVSAVYVGVDNQSQTGAWWELIADAVIAHNDGTLVPLYNGQGSFSFGGPTVGPGMSGVSYLDRHLQNIGHTTATTTYYYHGDQIGSSRLMTSPFGEPVWNATYLPYGEEYNPEITVNNRKFTGKEHDTESGLDYFGARYYGSALGRFITPDWAAKAAAVPYAEFADPQSLNLYSYVRNVPTTKMDSDGHCLWDLCIAEGTAAVITLGEALTMVGTGVALGAAVDHQGALGQRGQIDPNDSTSIAMSEGMVTLPAQGVNTQTPPSTTTAVPTANPGTTPTKVDTSTPASTSQAGTVSTTATAKNTGTIYVVPGKATPSGKPYVGRHNKPNPAKTRRSNDGRDRTQAKVVDTYPANKPQAGADAEQQEIDRRGGIDKLDNKINAKRQD